MAEFIVDKGQLDESIYLVKMIKEENKMEKEMTEESVPKLEKMDEEFPVFGPELPDETQSAFFGPELPPDLSSELPGNLEAIEGTLSVGTREEQALVLEGPKVANQ